MRGKKKNFNTYTTAGMHICVSRYTFAAQHISRLSYRYDVNARSECYWELLIRGFASELFLNLFKEQVGFHFFSWPQVPQADNEGSLRTESTPAHLSVLSKPPEHWPAYNLSDFPPALSAGTFRL